MIAVIKIIVVDLDGPILDGMHRHYQCYSDILKEHGAAPVPLQSYWDMKRNRVGRRKLLALSDAVGLYDEFLDAWMQRIEAKEYLALDRLQDGVVDILSQWKEAGTQLLLATMRNNPANLDWQLRRLDILRLLDKIVVVGSGSGEEGKSSKIRPLLGEVDLDKVIWVGDTEVDVYAARKLGVKVGALTCGLRTQEYLASLAPDMLEADLSSFAEKLKLARESRVGEAPES